MNHSASLNGSDIMEANIRSLPWQLRLFLITLILPVEASFYVGSLRLTPYRILLLITFIPCLQAVFSKERGNILPTDWLLLGYSIWMFLALAVNHGSSVALKSGGISMLESYGAYLITRRFIKNEKDFKNFAKLLIFIVCGLSLFTIPEALTGFNIFRPDISHIGKRMGLYRAFGPFDHPILYGVFCASAVSLSLYISFKETPNNKHLFRTGWVIVAAFMSVSSGALADVVVQLILIIWNKISAGWQNRWRLFIGLLIFAYFFVDLFSTHGPIYVLLDRLTFSSYTAWNRLIIWEWGTSHNVAVHPWFGIGFSDWVRPIWMHNASMDNFWLVVMVRFGLPAFGLLSAGILHLLFSVGRKTLVDDTIKRMRLGWAFSVIGMIIAGTTVDFWNSGYVWFFCLLGSGAWFLSSHSEEDRKIKTKYHFSSIS